MLKLESSCSTVQRNTDIKIFKIILKKTLRWEPTLVLYGYCCESDMPRHCINVDSLFLIIIRNFSIKTSYSRHIKEDITEDLNLVCFQSQLLFLKNYILGRRKMF